MKRNQRIRNAAKARNSFVTRRAEIKLSALANFFRDAAETRWEQTETGTLRRRLIFRGFRYLDSLQLIYNWENRFMAVNYNLQMVCEIPVDSARFQETGESLLTLKCTQKGLGGGRKYQWEAKAWEGGDEILAEYRQRLTLPLITERLDALDILEMELRHSDGQDSWVISCESLIGSATWMLLPPVFSMITPKKAECIKFLELFELLADAVVNNRPAGEPDAPRESDLPEHAG